MRIQPGPNYPNQPTQQTQANQQQASTLSLVEPLGAIAPNGSIEFDLSLADVGLSLYAILFDSPDLGDATTLDLTNVTSIEAILQPQSGSGAQILATAQVVVPNGIPLPATTAQFRTPPSATGSLVALPFTSGVIAAITPRRYSVSFLVTFTNSEIVEFPAIALNAFGQGLIEDFTYDLATPLGQTRYHAADTIAACAIFGDKELNYLLTNVGGVPELAAAKALRGAAADRARLAVIVRIGQLGNDRSKVYSALIQMAESLESMVATAPVVGVAGGDAVADTLTYSNLPDPVFTMDTNGGANPGTMHRW